MKLNENWSIDPKAVEAMMRLCAEKEICTYVHNELLEEFGQASGVEELIKHFRGETVDIPGFTVGQKLCATFLMVKFNILQGIAVHELVNTKSAMEDDYCVMEGANYEEGGDDDMTDADEV